MRPRSTRRGTRPRALVLGVLLLCGCDRESSSPAAALSATAATATALSATVTPPPPHVSAPDRSLSADEYISLGMPSYDRKWTGQDIAVAASKLQALPASQLPRSGSKRSGPMFARIVARDNLDIFRLSSLPVATRISASVNAVESLNAVLKVYLSALVANPAGETGAELVELMGAELRAVEVALDLIDEYVPTLSKKDPQYSARLAGLEQIRQGLAMLLSGVLTLLGGGAIDDLHTRANLLGYCREALPGIVPRLSAPSQQEVLRRLNDLAEEQGDGELRPQLVALRDEVRTSIQGSARKKTR